MIKAIIFDLDGTLADTIGSIRTAINMAMQHYGFPEHDYEAVRRAIGNGARMLIRRLVPSDVTDDARVTEILNYYNACYAKTYTEANTCYDGMKNAVLELHRRGYKLAVLSNKPDVYTAALTKILFPEGIISIAQGQLDSVPTKPDPTAPLDIAARLGVTADECAFVGDSEVDILTAKNAKMYSVGCSWGYRPRDVLTETGADVIIDSPVQILEIFK